ncbi:MAG: sulfotransferase [Leptospirales bacterium]
MFKFWRKNKSLWPRPNYKINKEPHFLFILTPAGAGSTALARLLQTAEGTSLLNKRGEGIWLVPGMGGENKWEQIKYIDWISVKSVWMKRIQEINETQKLTNVIIDKSPSNLVRIDKLTECFPNHTLAAINRNPYAYCSSRMYRRYDPENKSTSERIKIIELLTNEWLSRSGWIIKWIKKYDVIFFTYEQFCSDTAGCIKQLATKIPAFIMTDINCYVDVKDYAPQQIINCNEVQISMLSQNEIDAISRILNNNIDTVSFFQYEIM